MKNKLIYLFFGVVVVIAIIIFVTNHKGTIKKELRDFAYEDTASVNKIFLADKNNNTILLERQDNVWFVNKKYVARKDAIKLLLETIASIDVKSPVPQPALPRITKLLATKSVKVEIYANDKRVKTYFVGDATPDDLGTYMILENSKVPFVMYKPGFNGYLTVRYFIDENDWRDVSLFPIPINKLYSVNVRAIGGQNLSFTIVRKSPYDYQLLDAQNKPVTGYDTLALKEYAADAIRAKAQSWEIYIPKERVDSIKHAVPFVQITLKSIDGKSYNLKLYRHPNINSSTNDKAELLPYDPDIMYGLSNDKDITICQYFVFDPLLVPMDIFLKKNAKNVNKKTSLLINHSQFGISNLPIS